MELRNQKDSLRFENIISTTSHYGVVWKATYNGQPCAVKVVILTTGLHYDHKKKKYRGDAKKPEEHFAQDERAPYLHTLYKERKAMPRDDFEHEAEMIEKMSKMNLGPKLFGVWIDEKRPMHYGFIAMEFMTETVKGILLKRDLTGNELQRIRETIDRLHGKGICHGDCKPSNIGVTLDANGNVDQIRFLDLMKCRPIKHRHEIERDLDTFKRHAKDNTELRESTLKEK